jgi:hypothetical protein
MTDKKLFDKLKEAAMIEIEKIVAEHGEDYFKNNFSWIGRNHINKIQNL